MIASKTQKDRETALGFSVEVKNIMRENVSKIMLIVYAIDRVLSNPGSRTPGVDGIQYERTKTGKNSKGYINATSLALAISVKFLRYYKCRPVKKLHIFKVNGQKSSIGIFCIVDRVVQEMFRLVIDPAIDVKSDPNSYGFRKRRSCHQALGTISHLMAKTSGNSVILDYEIKGFFDSINHS